MLTFMRHSKRLMPRDSWMKSRLSTNTAFFSSATSKTPWFVDEEPETRTREEQDVSFSARLKAAPELPPDLPEHLQLLHRELARLPHLDASALEIRPPFPTTPGPPLEHSFPKGKRKRGGTEFGEGVADLSPGIWRWIVLAQVKEGTEARGSIGSVMRVVRKSLLSVQPPLLLPPNRRRTNGDGWAMIDAGDFAVHIVSKDARERFFPVGTVRHWEW